MSMFIECHIIFKNNDIINNINMTMIYFKLYIYK